MANRICVHLSTKLERTYCKGNLSQLSLFKTLPLWGWDRSSKDMVNSYEKRGHERFRHVNESLRINGNGMVLIFFKQKF